MPIEFSFHTFSSLDPQTLYEWLALRIEVFVV